MVNGHDATVERLELRTADGERLVGVHVPGGDPLDPLALGVVVAHGFTGHMGKPGLRAVVHGLAPHAGLVVNDFRGHGRSSGVSTLGDREIHDVEAGVREAKARGYRAVVTMGWSMGGAVVIRHAAQMGGVDAVVSISATSRWFVRDTRPMRRVHRMVETRSGRLVTRLVFGTRISGSAWVVVPDPPVDVVGRISPIPLLLVHGDRDPYFTLDHPRALFEAAREPREFWELAGYGHAEAAADAALLTRLGQHLRVLVARGHHPDG